MNKWNIFSSKNTTSLPQPNDYPHCLFFSPFQSQIFGGAAHLHLLVSPSLSPHQAHSRLHGNPSHEGLHVASSTSNGSFQPFQGFSELLDTLSVALSCLESSIVGSSFVNPGSSQAPLPQPFQHFQYWGSSRHCSQLSSLYSLPPSLRPLIPHPQGSQLPLVF